MIRILLDEYGCVSTNLFVIIDGSPGRVWLAGTSWLEPFFDNFDNYVGTMSDEELSLANKADVASLIRLWQKMLLSDKPICYLPLDLSDQCGEALQITKRKKLYHVTRVWSPDITKGMSSPRFLQRQDAITWQQGIDQGIEWELAPSSIQIGLNWSLAQLEQPIVPLRYD